MTRRERMEARLAKRETWAKKREQDAQAAHERALRLTDGIPFGQPILVGHHSEKRHRRTLQKADDAMRRGSEALALSRHHASKAAGIEDQLRTSIYSDDTDAVAQITARIELRQAEAARMARLNKWWRTHGTMRGCPTVSDAEASAWDRDIPTRYSWEQKGPFPPYMLSNLRGRIAADKKRLVAITRQQERAAEAEAAPGGLTIRTSGGWCSVTFAEKPSREVLTALRAAGFHWGAGAWSGREASLPAIVRQLAEAAHA